MAEEADHGTYRYRWLVLASFMFVAAVTQLMWLNYAPITSQTESLMHVSEFKVVALALMFPLLYIPVSIPAGIVIDRKGYRYAVMIGAVLTTVFSFVRLFAGNYWLVLIGMIGISIGQPFVLNSITKMVATWFPTEESALADGLATLSLFLGMILALALTPALLSVFGKNNISSLRYIVFIYSLISVGSLVLFALFAKARPPKPPKRTETDVAGADAAINWENFKALFRLSNFRLLCVILLIGNGSFVGLLQLMEKIMKPKGINTDTAGFIGAVMVVAGVVGCIVLPAISDKVMRRKPFVLIAAGMAVPTIFIISIVNHNTPLIFGVGAMLGFFMFSAFPIVLAYSEETTGSALTGTATSVLLLLGNAGGVIITLIMESLKGAFGVAPDSFFWALIFLVILFAIGFAIATRLHESPAMLEAQASRD